ncbi:hypothetical protein [Aeromonas veronii]|uniref:hypothetical protein n=1 Tax=Aeromonas veronii TaxID=654 RepID=UPI00311CCCFD
MNSLRQCHKLGMSHYLSVEKKEQSNIDMNDSIEHIFDKIRVLDVDGYPPAYIDVGKYRLIFSHPIMRLSGDIEAHVRIQKHND